MGRLSWTRKQLEAAVAASTSLRQVIAKLGLCEAGGNYVQVKKYIEQYQLPTEHFTGRAWNRGLRVPRPNKRPLEELLRYGSQVGSHKLKLRLFQEGLKQPRCEECGWARRSADGRVPVELDHVNGDSADNRLANLRILCPNCHSLKPTHRGRNKRKRRPPARVVE